MNIKDTGKPFDIPGWGTGTEKVVKSFPLENEVQYLRIIQERIRDKRNDMCGVTWIGHVRAAGLLGEAADKVKQAIEELENAGN